MALTARMLLLCLCLPGAGRAAAARPLDIDFPRSTIEVRVHSTFDSFIGRLRRFKARILLDPDAMSVERARLDFDFADLSTGRRRRDQDMLDWQDNAGHPAATFHLDRIERVNGESARAHGSLEIHGVRHAVTFPVSFLTEGRAVAIDGEVALDYRDYGLPVIRKFFLLTVDPHLFVRFHLQGTLAAGTE